MSKEQSVYRPEIDGLRAIAVVSVILFHADISSIQGGFVGVDIFFVISGFLITQIIIKQLQNGSFSFLDFYSRRIKRLLPAALLMLFITVLFGYFILTPEKYVELAKSAVFTSIFVANFWFATHSGYFDQSTEISPLVHMWSLAVEEQFYLFVPFLFFALFSLFKLLGIRALVLVILSVSLSLSIVFSAQEPNYSFYLLPTRAWELCIGASIVIFPSLIPINDKFRNVYATTGLILLAGSLFFISENLPFPGSVALFPALGTALLLASLNSKSIVGYSFLTSSVLVTIGKLSYSAYLWHWPIIVYYRIYISERDFTGIETIFMVILSLFLGYLSYRFIEERFRYSKLDQKYIFTIACTFIAIAVALPLGIYYSKGFPDRIDVETTAMTNTELMWQWKCTEEISPFPGNDGSYCVIGNKWEITDAKGIIWGDSHSEHWAPLFDQYAKENNLYLVVAPGGCPPYLNSNYVLTNYPRYPEFTEDCTKKHEMIVNWLNDQTDVRYIIMASAWSWHSRMLYTSDYPQNSINFTVKNTDGVSAGAVLSESALLKTVLSLNLINKKVLILGDIPRANRNLNECVLNDSKNLFRAKCTKSYRQLDAKLVRNWHELTEQALLNVSGQFGNVEFISAVETLCGEVICPTFLNGELLYKDDNHLRRNLHMDTVKLFAAKLKIQEILNK